MVLHTLWVSYLADYVNAVYGVSYTTFRPMSFRSRGSSTISVPILYVRLIYRHLPFPYIHRFLLNRPVVVRNIDPADWLLDLWHFQTYPRRTTIYDFSRESRLCRNLQYSAHPRDNGCSRPWWYFPRAVLRPHRCRLLLLQSVFKFSPHLSHNSYHLRLPALLPLHRSLLLFMGLLDRS
jgi:hypothetical protein